MRIERDRMIRATACVLAPATIAGCATSDGLRSSATRYCSVITHEPCLDQQRTGNCLPCAG